VAFAHVELILFPTDFSRSSEAALPAAIALARALGARIEVFHVDLDPSGESPLAESLIPFRMAVESQRAEAAEKLRRLTQQVQSAGVPCTGTAELGRSAARAIVEHARRTGAGLIVIGKHHGQAFRRSIGRMFAGHISGRVVEHPPCPVLVVPLPSD
jgi:nucleotide-binding universal stress UspA family protein